MADLSKIKLNGTIYNLKDAWLRENIHDPEDDANVIKMLQDDGLDASITLEPAIVGTAKVGSAVVQSTVYESAVADSTKVGAAIVA